MAAAIPGGRYGALPLEKMPFRASLRITELGHGFSVRGIKTMAPVALRAELTATWPAVAYVLPSIDGTSALFDGREVSNRTIVSRVVGHTPTMRTFAANEIASFTISVDALREAGEALTGRSQEAILISPATIMDAGTVDIQRLRRLHRAAGEMLELYSPDRLDIAELPALAVLRDEIMCTLVQGLAGAGVKADHQARQLQTRSMARIDRYLDAHPESAYCLQTLCSATDIPLRTVEAIIRSRTGLPAIQYLRRRRLAFVRQALLKPNTGATVTSIALQFGFWHLGRFSDYYRQVYGEPPTATLSRTVGRL